MADRGRDLKISILSDVDRFDLDQPAAELEGLGDKAKATAEKIDNAFDKIAKSSRSNLRKVDADADKAKKGLDDFKDEAADTGREAAASFSGGFEDITDAVQEIGANAFSKLGKVGMAAGGALAISLGFVISKVNEVNERVKAASDSFFELGRSGATGLERMEAAVDRLRDASQLDDVADAAKSLGLNLSDVAAALDGNKDAYDRVIRVADDAANKHLGLATAYDDEAKAGQNLGNILREQNRGLQDANKEVSAAAQLIDEKRRAEEKAAAATEAAAKAMEEQAKVAERVSDAISGSIREVGDAKDEIDSLVTKAEEGGRLTLAAMIATLEEQTKAAKDQQANLQVAMEEGGADFAEFMAGLPAEAAAAYVKGSAAERAAFRRAAFANGQAQQEGHVSGARSKIPDVERVARDTRAAVKRGLLGDGPIKIPVGVQPPGQATLNGLRSSIQLGIGTITVPVKSRVLSTARDTP